MPSAAVGAGLTNYTINYANGSMTVSPVPLTIMASGASVTYGAPVPAITAGYSAFVNDETTLSLTTQPTCGTTYSQGSPVSGSPYPSTCMGAVDGNYTISYGPGSVIVTQAALQITASSATVTAGAAVPTITPSYSGFVNGENYPMLTTQPSCTTTYTTSSAVGSPERHPARAQWITTTPLPTWAAQ